MIKAATIPLSLSLLFAGVPAAFAQPTGPTKAAIDEGVRRQAARQELQTLLDQAISAQRRHDLPQAAKLYDAAWEKVVYVGQNVDAEAEVTKSGLASVRLELAREAQRRGNLLEADVQVKDLLRVDPINRTAIEFRRANDQMMIAQKGTVP